MSENPSIKVRTSALKRCFLKTFSNNLLVPFVTGPAGRPWLLSFAASWESERQLTSSIVRLINRSYFPASNGFVYVLAAIIRFYRQNSSSDLYLGFMLRPGCQCQALRRHHFPSKLVASLLRRQRLLVWLQFQNQFQFH